LKIILKFLKKNQWEYKYGMLLVQGLITGVNNYNLLKIEVLSKYFDNNVGLFKNEILKF